MKNSSILASIKELYMIDTDRFDDEFLRIINEGFDELRKLKIEPPGGFPTINATTTWEEAVPQYGMFIVKPYIEGYVRMEVDPSLALLR